MVRIISTSKIRRKMAEVVNQADEHGEPIYLTNYDEPKAVLIGYQAWEDLMGRMEDLEDLVSIYRGREEPTRPLDDFLAELEREEAAQRQSVAMVA